MQLFSEVRVTVAEKLVQPLVSSRRNNGPVYYKKARAHLGSTNCELFDLVLSCQRRKISL